MVILGDLEFEKVYAVEETVEKPMVDQGLPKVGVAAATVVEVSTVVQELPEVDAAMETVEA